MDELNLPDYVNQIVAKAEDPGFEDELKSILNDLVKTVSRITFEKNMSIFEAKSSYVKRV